MANALKRAKVISHHHWGAFYDLVQMSETVLWETQSAHGAYCTVTVATIRAIETLEAVTEPGARRQVQLRMAGSLWYISRQHANAPFFIHS